MDPLPWANFPNFPFVLRHKIDDWQILKYEENDWIHDFGNAVLDFREGKKIFSEMPCWERSCAKKQLTLKEFFEISKRSDESWLYFDYKHLRKFLPVSSALCKSIKWSNFNLKNCNPQDSTLWIGNKGAHTPCHMDTYGCNLVAQIFGRKLWILIPPEETHAMNCVRIPYEESSIYSGHNFYTPSKKILKIRQAYKVILSPGEVLYVPRHWWHYVENLDVAISVNTWIPLDVDHESRLEECLVRHFTFNICQDLAEGEVHQLLNPNEESLLDESNLLNTLQKCMENCFEQKKNQFKKKDNHYFSDFSEDSERLRKSDLRKFVEEKSRDHGYNPEIFRQTEPTTTVTRLDLAKALINLHCHPNSIGALKDNLLSQFT